MAKVYIAWGVSGVTDQVYLIGVYRHIEDAQKIRCVEITTEDIMESVDQPITLHLETGQQITLSPKDEVTVEAKIILARQLKTGDAVKVSRREPTHDFIGETKPVYVKILKIRTANGEE